MQTIIQRVVRARLAHKETPAERLRLFLGKAETKELNAILDAHIKASLVPKGSAFGMEWYCTDTPSELRVEVKA